VVQPRLPDAILLWLKVRPNPRAYHSGSPTFYQSIYVENSMLLPRNVSAAE